LVLAAGWVGEVPVPVVVEVEELGAAGVVRETFEPSAYVMVVVVEPSALVEVELVSPEVDWLCSSEARSDPPPPAPWAWW
jgi:hypothetical protein